MAEKYCDKCKKITRTRISSVGNIECLECFINGIEKEVFKKKNNNFLTIEESKKSLEELKEKSKQTPGQTYLKKYEDFRNSLTEEENEIYCKYENDTNDSRKNQILQEVADDVNELFMRSSDIYVNKNDVIAILVDRIKTKD